MAWNRSKQETLALPIDSLALLILKDYVDVGGWNSRNWVIESQQHGSAADIEVSNALYEGWAWLITHGLVSRDATQDSADAYRVTRLGRQTLDHGVGRLAAAERLGISLHPRLAQRVAQQFLLGEYELAVFAAIRKVEIRTREVAGFPNSSLGTKMMQAAFSPNDPGPLTDPNAEPSEQVAAMNLFSGAIGLFKNPSSHRPVDYDDPVFAGDIVMFADLLLRMLDRIAQRTADEG